MSVDPWILVMARELTVIQLQVQTLISLLTDQATFDRQIRSLQRAGGRALLGHLYRELVALHRAAQARPQTHTPRTEQDDLEWMDRQWHRTDDPGWPGDRG